LRRRKRPPGSRGHAAAKTLRVRDLLHSFLLLVGRSRALLAARRPRREVVRRLTGVVVEELFRTRVSNGLLGSFTFDISESPITTQTFGST
jgi:hypothetical protein